MSEKIIDVTSANTTVVQDEVLKQLKELNDKLTNADGGEWVNTADYGICWHPKPGDRMGEPLGVPAPSTPPLALESLVKWGDTLDVDSLKDNAVVMIKLDATDPLRANIMSQMIAKQVLEPRIEVLKSKKICILFLGNEDSIDVLTEEDMGKAGWVKKEPSRIITL